MHIASINKDLLPGLIKDAATRRKSEQRGFLISVSKKVKQWAIKAVSGHAREGHAFLKKPPRKPPDHIVEDGIAVLDPRCIMKGKFDFWGKLWTAVGSHTITSAGAEISKPIRALAIQI